VVLGCWLDLMILEVFSNLNDSMILRAVVRVLKLRGRSAPRQILGGEGGTGVSDARSQ